MEQMKKDENIKAFSQSLQGYSLIFKDPLYEEYYRKESNASLRTFFPKLITYSLMIAGLVRRLELIIEVSLGLLRSDLMVEIRATLVFFAGIILEFIVHRCASLSRFRWMIYTIVVYYIIMDSSVMYYIAKINHEPVFPLS